MHATKTLELELIELREVEAQVSTWFSWFNLAGGGRFELPHARALQAAAAELKEPDKVQATVGASSAYELAETQSQDQLEMVAFQL